ncbi:MAG: hypothetical protein Q4G62_12600, partial [Pseudomonadota bacterium]|nr:hypothetical protein [Pseudomonadota bacterium]
GGGLIPPPAGVDVTSMDSLKASMHLFEAKHFVFPFLAHAFGTLVGVFVAALIAPASRYWPAYTVAGLFLLGGVINVMLLPAPLWFSALDLLLAYLPMAWLGRAAALAIKAR